MNAERQPLRAQRDPGMPMGKPVGMPQPYCKVFPRNLCSPNPVQVPQSPPNISTQPYHTQYSTICGDPGCQGPSKGWPGPRLDTEQCRGENGLLRAPGHPPLTQGGRGRVHPRLLILAGNLLEAQTKIVGEDEGSWGAGRLRYEGCISLSPLPSVRPPQARAGLWGPMRRDWTLQGHFRGDSQLSRFPLR